MLSVLNKIFTSIAALFYWLNLLSLKMGSTFEEQHLDQWFPTCGLQESIWEFVTALMEFEKKT